MGADDGYKQWVHPFINGKPYVSTAAHRYGIS